MERTEQKVSVKDLRGPYLDYLRNTLTQIVLLGVLILLVAQLVDRFTWALLAVSLLLGCTIAFGIWAATTLFMERALGSERYPSTRELFRALWRRRGLVLAIPLMFFVIWIAVAVSGISAYRSALKAFQGCGSAVQYPVAPH